MALDDVTVGDPHASAHNEERHAINALETAVDALEAVPKFARGVATDLNALTGAENAGSWRYTGSSANIPPIPNGGVVTVAASEGTNQSGQFAQANNGTTWVRWFTGSGWTAWQRFDIDTGAIRFDSQQTGITETQKYYAKLNSGINHPGFFIGDLNTLFGHLKAASYVISATGSSNLPVVGQAGVLLVEAPVSNVAITRQTYSLRNGDTYVRVYNDSTSAWTAWRRIDLPTTTANELRGTGSPLGVVAAPPGTYYTDTAGTFGAWRWLKTSGTGTTGWVVVYGDTGLRRVSSMLAPSVEYSTATLLIRREGDLVTLSADNLTLTSPADSHSDLIVLPDGYIPNPIVRVSGLYELPGNLYSSGRNLRPTLSVPAGSRRFYLQYRTTSAWPTSLPGDPA